MQNTTLYPTVSADQKHIAIWLLICCTTVFGMILLGSVTRITGSGPSMVQWAPIMSIMIVP